LHILLKTIHSCHLNCCKWHECYFKSK
jgi:hypothetical protein